MTFHSVVQRQMWLLSNDPNMTKAQVYDQARREFYLIRHQEEVERRVAREEASSTGAYFGKSALEFGMEIEDMEYEKWKAWAKKEIAALEQSRSSSYTGIDIESPELGVDDLGTQGAADEVESLVSAS